MGIGDFLGGMAVAYQGARQGVQDNINRLNAEKDREYLEQQRAYQGEQQEFQRGQQRRSLSEQARADKLRDDLSNIAPTKSVDTNVVKFDDDGNAMPTATKEAARTQDEMLRDVAKAYRDAGDIGRFMELSAKADEIGMARSAELFQRVRAGAGSKTAGQIAQEVADIYNNDPMPAQVTDIKDSPDGSVEITIHDRQLNSTHTRKFENSAKLLETLESYYSPKSYAALAQKRAELALEAEKKRAEAQAKPVTLSQGGTFIPGVGDPRPMFTAPSTDARGGKSGGAGGKGDKTPADLARDILSDIAEKSEDKPTMQQRADAESFLGRLLQQNPGVPPERAARIALVAATNPQATTPSINPTTGTIDQTFLDDDGSRYVLKPGYATAENVEARGVSKADMKAAAKALVQKQGDAEYQRLFVSAAFDPNAREQLVQRALAAMDQAVQQAVSKDPSQEIEIRQRATARLQQDIRNLDRKLDIVHAYGDPPKAEKAASPASVIPAVGGLSRPMTREQRQARVEEARTAQAAQEKAANEKAAQTAAELLKSGDVVQAAKFQASSDFGRVDKKTQLEIYRIVNGLRGQNQTYATR